MLYLLAILAPLALIGGLSGSDDEPEVLDGTDGNDTLNGSADDGLIQGYGGDDNLTGGEGSDTVFGQAGDDLLMGNGGNDMLCSGDGDDVISGNRGSDMIEGQGGDDWASGDYNSDRVFGNEGNDTVIGGRGTDVVVGNEGDDVVFGGILRGVPLEEDELEALRDGESLADVLAGSELNIDLRDDERSDTLSGGAGDDQLFLTSADEATGGFGADTFNILADDDYEDRPVPRIMDFNPAVDSITVVFDAPLDIQEITVEGSGDDALILADGVRVAVVSGGNGSVSAEDVSILTEASVAGLFDPNAAAA